MNTECYAVDAPLSGRALSEPFVRSSLERPAVYILQNRLVIRDFVSGTSYQDRRVA